MLSPQRFLTISANENKQKIFQPVPSLHGAFSQEIAVCGSLVYYSGLLLE